MPIYTNLFLLLQLLGEQIPVPLGFCKHRVYLAGGIVLVTYLTGLRWGLVGDNIKHVVVVSFYLWGERVCYIFTGA